MNKKLFFYLYQRGNLQLTYKKIKKKMDLFPA